MPDLLDPVEAKQIRDPSVFGHGSLAFGPTSETKALYLRAKESQRIAGREKRPYLVVRGHYCADDERDFFKMLAKSGHRTYYFVKVLSFGGVCSSELSEEGQSEVPVSPSKLYRKLRIELCPDTFHELKQVIRSEGIGELVARRSKDASRRDQSFISRARELDARGHTDAALDLIYDSVDKLMRDGEFQKLDSILSNVPVADTTLDVHLGLLTATLPARNRLPSRKLLYGQIEQTLRNRGQLEPGLLTGLE